jgi:RND family efflux transporter MFP subunit
VGAQPEFGPRDFEPIGRDRVRLEAVAGSRGALAAWTDRLRREPKKWAAIALAIVLAIFAVIWAMNPSTPAPPSGATAAGEESLPLVTVMKPSFRSVTATVSFTGTISARHDMPIGAEGEGGRITAVYVEAGDNVRRGQILARLDQSVILPQVNRLKASLEEARAQAALSEAEYRRAKGVESAGALSAEEIERRRAAAVTDEARVNVAAAQLAEAEARLDRTEIRAPAAGVVLTRNAEVGQTAVPGGEALFRLASGAEIEMRGQIAEQDLARVQVGQPATVYLTGIAAPFNGRVRLLGAVIDPDTRLGEIRIALEPHPSLRPGAFARGQVSVSEAQRAVLPQTAVLADQRGNYVLIVNAEQQAERRDVRVADTIAEGIVISEGLQGDERVISTAGGFLRAGEKVAVATEQSTQP